MIVPMTPRTIVCIRPSEERLVCMPVLRTHEVTR